MKRAILSLLLPFAATLFCLSQIQSPSNGAGAARGRYLVEEVARCGECHTPKDDKGRWDETQWLKGAPLWFKPVKPMEEWGYWAPRLAGLPNFSDDQARSVLEQGTGPNGLALRPPMHLYHLSREDAEAIIAYLRSRR
jgi:mono/diheme cytochrome c family protein